MLCVLSLMISGAGLAQFDACFDCGVVHDIDGALVIRIALFETGEIADVTTGGEDGGNTRHLGDFIGVFQTLQRFDHQNQHQVIVDGVAQSDSDADVVDDDVRARRDEVAVLLDRVRPRRAREPIQLLRWPEDLAGSVRRCRGPALEAVRTF